jgi:hypothetical protein
LAEVGFFDLPANLIRERWADSFVYQLTVVTDEKEHTVLCSEENVPEELRPLLRQLTIMARRG